MGRPRSNSPPKKNTATAPTSSPRTSPRKIDKATELSKAESGDTTKKAAATLPTSPRVTRGQNKSGATGNMTNTKDGDNLTDAKNEGKNKSQMLKIQLEQRTIWEMTTTFNWTARMKAMTSKKKSQNSKRRETRKAK